MGQKVAVAVVGTVLPGDFKIKKTKIRGIDSSGMICSEKELGLSDSHEGIMVLSKTFKPTVTLRSIGLQLVKNHREQKKKIRAWPQFGNRIFVFPS